MEATLATMVEDASVNHVPVNTGGKGKTELRAFYRDVFIGSWPDDLQMTTFNRVFGQDQLVEEDHLRFTHKNRMDWFLPGVPATNRLVEADFVIVVQFRDGKLACERISLGPGDGPAPDRAGEGVDGAARPLRGAIVRGLQGLERS